MIRLENIQKYYGEKTRKLQVLKGVDLHIASGEMIAVMGSSGSGKSTLLNILGILDQHDGGYYYLDGQRVERLSEKRAAHYRNLHMGFVFQAFNLLPFKNAMENVSLPLYYQKVGRKERNRRALEMLDKVGLAERTMHRPHELSGGQKQRVAIARALVTDPRVILADEPTGALDSATTADIMSLFKHINDAGKTIVIVTHEQDIARACSRLIHLHDGRVVDTPPSSK